MKITMIVAVLVALGIPTHACANELLKDVSEIYIGIEFKGLPDASVGPLKSKLEQSAKKAGLKVVGSGTMDEYEQWCDKQQKKEVLLTPVVTVTCSVMTAKGGVHAYAACVHVERMGFVEMKDGPFTLSVEPSKQKFKAGMATATLFPSDLVIGLNRDMTVVGQEVETKFEEFLTAWSEVR